MIRLALATAAEAISLRRARCSRSREKLDAIQRLNPRVVSAEAPDTYNVASRSQGCRTDPDRKRRRTYDPEGRDGRSDTDDEPREHSCGTDIQCVEGGQLCPHAPVIQPMKCLFEICTVSHLFQGRALKIEQDRAQTCEPLVRTEGDDGIPGKRSGLGKKDRQ